ncbi:hypothetical protein J2W32_004429 [Variovorax boronicumulans]|uniref:Uncharacterized protein n=1 Tax=Variovorax boronicumulans TaxID=436515 RepID=A0AAW8D6B8_9BURK|nr:hypothetical protein [Variovorax boronicumulans]MDP9895331.1 hypothetical protein [Variovorax boronicumulans]MDQ0055371.1 hypothetical protein [Variovorax boronicumulans]
MSKVSTRPQKVATPVTAAVTAVTAASPSEQSDTLPEEWRTAAIESRDAVSRLVFEAKVLDEEERDDACGMAKRLMSVAVAEFNETSTDATKNEFEAAAFNTEALIYGALDISADKVGPKAEANLRHALLILDRLTDHLVGGFEVHRVFDAIRSAPVPVAPRRKPFNGHSNKQVDLVLNDIATHANTLRHFVRNVGEGQEETAFELVAMGLQIIGAAADQLAGMTAIGGPCEWLVGDVFYEAGKAVSA